MHIKGHPQKPNPALLRLGEYAISLYCLFKNRYKTYNRCIHMLMHIFSFHSTAVDFITSTFMVWPIDGTVQMMFMFYPSCDHDVWYPSLT